MKKGFTLAEVLITLAIIGVVAALTIPVVVAKYQKHAQYTQFMKVYNTLQTVFQLAVNEQGDVESWEDQNSDPQQFFDTYIGPYLKNYSMTRAGNVYTSGLIVKNLKGDIYLQGEEGDENMEAPMLQDGTVIIPAGVYSGPTLTMIVDTNGGKGPNTVGRDMFLLSYGKVLYPKSPLYGKGGVSIATSDSVEIDDCCSTTASCSGDDSVTAGVTCPLKLIQEGKMDY